MNCFSELTYSIFCDGECQPEEARSIQQHLESCERCRQLVAALREENQALKFSLQQSADVPQESPTHTFSFVSFVWKTAAVVIAAAFPVIALGWIAQQVPPISRWLDPLDFSWVMEVITRLVFLLTRNGAAMSAYLDQFANSLTLLLVVVLTGVVLIRLRARWLRPSLGLLLLFLFALPIYPMTIRSGKAITIVKSNETIDDSLFATGDVVEIDGVVNGDLITFGRRVEVRGQIKGDLLAFAQQVEVTGSIGGSAISFSQSLDMRGHLGRNLYGCFSTLSTDPTTQIDGNVIVAGGDTKLEGTVARGIIVAGGTLDLKADVNQNALLRVDRLTIFEPARIGGDLTARMHDIKKAEIGPGVSIGGKKEIRPMVRKSPYIHPRFYFWKAVDLVGALLLGLVLWLIVPDFLDSTSKGIRSWGRSLGLGFAVLIGTPVAIIILAVSLIGIPIALLSAALYFVGFYMAELVFGLFLGRIILGGFSSTGIGLGAPLKSPGTRTTAAQGISFLLALLVGVLIIMILVRLPYRVGTIIHLLVFCFGFGTIVYQLYRALRPQTSQ